MVATINASVSSAGIVSTADASGIIKIQSNGVTTNALAWVNFVGSTAVISSSYNVSSITRFTSGGYTINFTNPLANTAYCPVASCCSFSATYLYAFMTPFSNFSGYAAPSTSAFSMIAVASNGGASWTGGDPAVVSVAVFGN
jgi:hypothetical protein